MNIKTLSLFFTFLLMMVSPLDSSDKTYITESVYPLLQMNAHIGAFKGAREGLCKQSKECSILAETIVYEARSEPVEGRRAVAFVVLNRVKDEKRWPNSVEGVVRQANQFSFWKDKHKQTKPTKEDWTKGYTTAYNVINGLVDNPVGDSVFYHSTSVKPKWSDRVEFIVQLNNHIFYKN